MNKNLHERFLSNFTTILKFRRVLSEESDRGCALFAGSYLDESLKNLLKAFFVIHANVDEDMFGSNGPSRTFSSRIMLSYYLGLVSMPVKKDLGAIKNIRNRFAHTIEDITFQDQSIKDLCSNLKFSVYKADGMPRDRFVTGVLGVLALIQAAELKVTRRAELGVEVDDGRLSALSEKHLNFQESMGPVVEKIKSMEIKDATEIEVFLDNIEDRDLRKKIAILLFNYIKTR